MPWSSVMIRITLGLELVSSLPMAKVLKAKRRRVAQSRRFCIRLGYGAREVADKAEERMRPNSHARHPDGFVSRADGKEEKP